ncbi:MAG: hypothetical protein JO152_08485 [Mycobacteriaceae bacterium]|nr:hypothetical protein [Mycobacteriaceae bacterium]
MTVLLTSLILIAPFALAAFLGWAAHRSAALRWRADQFQASAPMVGRLYERDRDALRVEHDLDAIQSRFERNPAWPVSGAIGERR